MTNERKKPRDKYSGFCQIDYTKNFEVTAHDEETAAQTVLEFLLNPRWADSVLDEINSLLIIVTKRENKSLGKEQCYALAERLDDGNYMLGLSPDFTRKIEIPGEFSDSKVFQCGYGPSRANAKSFKVKGKISFRTTFEVKANMPQIAALVVAKEIAKKKKQYFTSNDVQSFSIKVFGEETSSCCKASDCYWRGEYIQDGAFKLICEFEGEEHIGQVIKPNRKKG